MSVRGFWKIGCSSAASTALFKRASLGKQRLTQHPCHRNRDSLAFSKHLSFVPEANTVLSLRAFCLPYPNRKNTNSAFDLQPKVPHCFKSYWPMSVAFPTM